MMARKTNLTKIRPSYKQSLIKGKQVYGVVGKL